MGKAPRSDEALERIAERQRAFAHTSSHELRSPLTVMLGALEFVLDNGTDAEQASELLRSALSCSRNLYRLVENLEVLAEADSLVVKQEPVRLAHVIWAVVSDLESEGSRVCVEADPDLVVEGDYSRVRQLILNLVRNALAVTDHRRCVVMTAHRTHDGIRLDVSDGGPGFAHGSSGGGRVELTPEPFLHRPGASKGLGLGLWVAYQLANLMGGDIWVTNNPGGGATVSISLRQAGAETARAA